MSVDKIIEWTRNDDKSITVSSGTDDFKIVFCEVPRVSDNAERRFQRVRKPLADINEAKEDSLGRFFPFTIYGPQTDGDDKDKKKGSGSHFLAIKGKSSWSIDSDRANHYLRE